MEMLTVREALDIIYRSDQFNIEFVTYDERRNTGGKLKSIRGGWLAKHEKKVSSALSAGRKRRNHEAHKTLTVYRPNEHPVAVHTDLICKVNGREVTQS